MQQLISRSRSCTNSSRMETCRTCFTTHAKAQIVGTAWFFRVLTPRSRQTRGRRPHVPSSKSLCQRAQKTDALAYPLFGGRPGRLVFGDRRSVPVRSTASVEWLLCVRFRPVNSVLYFSVFLLKHGKKTGDFCGFPSFAELRRCRFQDAAAPESPRIAPRIGPESEARPAVAADSRQSDSESLESAIPRVYDA